MINTQAISLLILFFIVPYTIKYGASSVDLMPLNNSIKGFLMSLPRPIMMILMALPEQAVLHYMEPKLDITSKLLISIAMYVVHFAWNGFVMKPERSYNEIVWILGTALFAKLAFNVDTNTAIALIAADSIMTLSLRGL